MKWLTIMQYPAMLWKKKKKAKRKQSTQEQKSALHRQYSKKFGTERNSAVIAGH